MGLPDTPLLHQPLSYPALLNSTTPHHDWPHGAWNREWSGAVRKGTSEQDRTSCCRLPHDTCPHRHSVVTDRMDAADRLFQPPFPCQPCILYCHFHHHHHHQHHPACISASTSASHRSFLDRAELPITSLVSVRRLSGGLLTVSHFDDSISNYSRFESSNANSYISEC